MRPASAETDAVKAGGAGVDYAVYEQLHGPKILSAISGETLSAAEAITRLAANPLWLASDPDRDRHVLGAEHLQTLATILRTGGFFVFTREDIPPPPTGDGRSELDVLPPLPFPRMWIEVAGASRDERTLYDFDGHVVEWFGFAIIEETPFEQWRVISPISDGQVTQEILEKVANTPGANQAALDAIIARWKLPDGVYERIACREWTLKRDPEMENRIGVQVGSDLPLFNDLVKSGAIPADWAPFTQGWTEFPEILVQLLHTLGVVHESSMVPRPRRRAFQRRYGVEHPNIYWVHVRSTDEPVEGKGDREFHHRWLVRGHYRRQETGTHIVPGKGACTWVRPYVKGPEGAPWKGRPIYTTMTKEAVAAA